jgi:hypothetical protein
MIGKEFMSVFGLKVMIIVIGAKVSARVFSKLGYPSQG